MAAPVGIRNMPSPPTITLSSRCATGGRLSRTGAAAAATGVSPWSDAGLCLLAFPFVIETPTQFYKGFWVNGSAGTGSSEVGIWDEAYAKIVTTGSVAHSGASVPQAAAFAAAAQPILAPGQYYAGIAHTATTTNELTRWSIATTGAAIWQSQGCWRQAAITLGSLAATATPGDMTNVAFPLFGLITRSAFDA